MKRKKLLPLLLSAAMVVTMFPTGSLTVQAAGTSSSKMKVSDKVKADVDKTKFTHKEWTGTDYQDVNGKEVTGEDVFGINREDASTVLIPYQNADAAKKQYGTTMPVQNRVIFSYLQVRRTIGI